MTDEARAKPAGPPSEPWKPAFILFCLGAVALAWPWLSGAYTIPWDARAGAYPQLAFLARSIAAGDSPFWAPNVFAGHPQIADPQSLIFSPPFLLLALWTRAPSFIAADGMVFAMLTLAGLALMQFFRDHHWRPEGALVAAFAFAFGGSNAWRVQHVGEVLSICWFAITLMLLARALERSSRGYGFAAGITAGFMVLGRDQIAYLCVWLLVFYVVWHLLWGFFGAALRAAFMPLVCGLLAGILVVAIPIGFTIALAAQSNRPAIDFAGAVRGSLPPLSMLTAFVSNLYGVDGPMSEFWGPPSSLVWGANDFILARNMGAIYFGALPVLAMLLVVARGPMMLVRNVRFFAFGALLMALYAVGSYTPFFGWAYKLPGVDLYRRPADATFPLCAMLAVIGGHAVNEMLWRARLRERPQAKGEEQGALFLGVVMALAVLAVCAAVALDRGRFAQATQPLTIAGVAFAVAFIALLMVRKVHVTRPVLGVALLAILMTADLAVSNKPNESTALPPSVYDALRIGTQNETIAFIKKKLGEKSPDRRDRVELAAVGYEWPNAGLVHNFDHDLGFNPVRLKLFAVATGVGDQIAIPEQRKFSPLYAGFRSPMADLLGVRYVISGVPLREMDKTYQDGDLVELPRTTDAYIYENPRALPRVLFASEARKADFDAMMRDGNWPGVDFRRTVLLAEATAAPLKEPGTARIVSYRNTEIIVETQSPQGGWLVLNDVFHPWWRAEIDGAETPLLRANVIFRAVETPAGTHRITFRFAPFAGLYDDTRDWIERSIRARFN